MHFQNFRGLVPWPGLPRAILPLSLAAPSPSDDPLNQRASVGWKGMRAAERLVEQYMVRVESVSSYSGMVTAN